MKNLEISGGVLDKLANKHQVERKEVEQCFRNINGPLLIDNREDHRTNPPTLWFLSYTNKGPFTQDRVYTKRLNDPSEDVL